jgi:hypothetical protein
MNWPAGLGRAAHPNNTFASGGRGVYLSPQLGPTIDPATVADLDRVFAQLMFGEFIV